MTQEIIDGLKKEVVYLHSQLADKTLQLHYLNVRVDMKNQDCNARALERMYISEQLREMGLNLTSTGKIERKE